MAKRRNSSVPIDRSTSVMHTLQSATTTGKNIWSILITAGVFIATIWTTQQVVNTRLSFLEAEIATLKAKDVEMSKQLAESADTHQALLQEISNRLRDMELRFTELKTRVELAIDAKNQAKLSVGEKPN